MKGYFMKYSSKIILSLALLVPSFALAQAAAPAAAPAASALSASKIAVVDVQGIMRDSTAAKSVREALEAKQKSYQAEISKKEDALQKEDQSLAKEKATLSKDAFDKKVAAFREKATAVQKEVAAKKETWDKAYETSLAQIQKAVSSIIADIAQQKGFVIALPASQLLYRDAALDISQEVLTKLNAQLPKVDVKFEAPAADSASSKKHKSE